MATKSESKYERLRKIGIGSYGVVFKCINRQTGQIVAIKRYSENDSDPIIRKIAMREVRMLRQLRHPNLINLIEVFRRKRRLHLVFDYCELTVLDVIERYSNNCPLNLIKKIVWQTVNAINYCHTHNCIHRDIKPENILINQSGVVKLCDFGFARTIAGKQLIVSQPINGDASKLLYQLQRDSKMLSGSSNTNGNNNINNNYGSNKENGTCTTTIPSDELVLPFDSERQALTEYVATRWYRAPELLIGEIYYDIKIDIWALGCVAAELMRGEPVWPGKTDLDQLSIIKCSLGPLTTSQTHTLITQAIYDEANIERLLTQLPSMSESLERKLPTRIGQTGIEFVLACLQMDPTRRPNSDELLKHPFISSVKMTQFIARDSSPSNIPSSVARRQSGATLSHLPTTQNSSSSNGTNTTNRLNSQALMLAANSHITRSPNSKKSEGIAGRSNTSLASFNNLTNNGNPNGTISSIPRAISKPSLTSINDESRPFKQIKQQQQQQQPKQQQQLASQKYRKTSTLTESELTRQKRKQVPYSNRNHYNHF